MSTTTTNYGLIKPDTTDPILVGQLNDNADVIDAALKSLSDALDVAKLGIKYKGEVNYYSNLPSSGNQIGDAYTVKYAGSSGTTPDGTEYVWGTVSGTNQWINFSKDSYTKAEVDALLALKVDTAGTGLSKSGTTINHSNSTTAKTTQGFAQIAYDAQGHITGSTAATTAQVNAINSGIDSTKVAQIEANKTNILLIEQANGSKNQINIPNGTYTEGTSSYSVVNGTVTTTAVDTNTHAKTLVVWTLKAGTYVFYDDSSDSSAVQYRIYQQSPDTRLTPAGQNPATFTIANDTVVYLSCYTFKSGTMTTHPLLMTKAMWDAGFTDYQPYAMSNVKLTTKWTNMHTVSRITNASISFTPELNSHYLVLLQSGTDSGVLSVYRSAGGIKIATIINTTSATATESGGVVTISPSDWTFISVIDLA